MTYRSETLNVKREASFLERIALRSCDVSRFTFHEKLCHSQAGR